MESNDSPEIPNRGETSDIPGFPSGSALQESLFILNDRSITTIISGRNTSHYLQVSQLISWYFEPSQPQRITSRLKTMFNLSPSHQTTNYPWTTKSVLTQIYIKQNIHKHRTQHFRRISPFGITPVEKAHKARTRWYCGPFRRFINTRFLKKYKKKGMDSSNKKNSKILYKCITANTSVIWQHAAHTTDQLSSPNR